MSTIQNVEFPSATTSQFKTLILRMMPSEFANMGEGQLIAAIIAQAWADLHHYTSARKFFTNKASGLDVYCRLVGLDAQQLRAVFKKHNAAYKLWLQEMAA